MEGAETIRKGVGIGGETPPIFEKSDTLSHIQCDEIVRHSWQHENTERMRDKLLAGLKRLLKEL